MRGRGFSVLLRRRAPADRHTERQNDDPVLSRAQKFGDGIAAIEDDGHSSGTVNRYLPRRGADSRFAQVSVLFPSQGPAGRPRWHRLTVPPALSLAEQEDGHTEFIPAMLAAFRSIDNKRDRRCASERALNMARKSKLMAANNKTIASRRLSTGPFPNRGALFSGFARQSCVAVRSALCPY